MALPPTIVMVLAIVMIILAGRPLDPRPPVVEPLVELPAAARVADAEPDWGTASIAHAPVARRLAEEARPVERHQALVPPPERVVYVQGWRGQAAPSWPRKSRPANGLAARRTTSQLDEARTPGAASVQAP